MAQPPTYARQYDFTGFSASYPSDQQPGVSLDAEFNAARASVNAIITNLALIQRDDTRLANAVVTMDCLANDVLTFIGAGDSWTPRGAWVTSTNYVVGDVVTQGGATYVCAVAHTSGTFAVDLTANKWITLFDVVDTTIADGAVTTAKIAAGAVTSAKLDSALVISGTFKATAGLAAGTAAAGVFPLAVKLDSGDVLASIQRASKAQGAVGFRFEGGTSGKNWDFYQPAGEDVVKLRNVTGDITPVTFKDDGQTTFGFTARFTGYVTPTGGAGVEVGYSGGIGIVDSYDRDASAWKPLRQRCSAYTLYCNDVLIATGSGTGIDFLEASIGGAAIGYRDMPQNSQTASYTLALTDRGKHVSITTGGVIIPANASVAFPVGSRVSVFNDSAAVQNISITSDTLRHGGTTTTGTYKLPAYQLVTLVKVASTVWVVEASPSVYGARAWVNFQGTGTVTIRASANVSSITDNGTGDYTVNLATTMEDENYAVSAMLGFTATATSIRTKNSVALTTTAFALETMTENGTKIDTSNVFASILR